MSKGEINCPFCDFSKIADRLFYEDDNWLAFLAAPYYTSGHTIIAAKHKEGKGCPQGLGANVMIGFDSALSRVAKTLLEKYKAKDILVTSLRGKIEHNHWHLIPLHESEEKSWRQKSGHNSGHLFGFLGNLEKDGVERAERERREKKMCIEEQRSRITEELKPHVEALRRLTGYSTA